MPVTRIDDIACIRGALKSVLKDAYEDDIEAKRILTVIDNQTGKNGDAPNVTQWNRDCLMTDLEKELFACEYIEVDTGENFSKLIKKAGDNVSSFSILFWRGNDVGEHCHATRIVSVINDTTLTLLDTTKLGGKICDYGKDELFATSTKGFTFLRMEKKLLS